jgi:hypothetical protein
VAEEGGGHGHGGGITWLPRTWNPELNLLYWRTGNANPVFCRAEPEGATPLDGIGLAICRARGRYGRCFELDSTKGKNLFSKPFLKPKTGRKASASSRAGEGAESGWIDDRYTSGGSNQLAAAELRPADRVLLPERE